VTDPRGVNKRDYVIVGNGASLENFDWQRFNHELVVIACNGAWEKLPIQPDLVVASDEHWVKYNKQHCPVPHYTTDVWATKWAVHSVPGSWTALTTGALGIVLASVFDPERIYCIGFDVLTLDSNERYHDHEIKTRMIANTKRFTDDYYKAMSHALPSKTELLVTPKQWEKSLYK